MIGVDDAGRGVLIGPMVVAGVKTDDKEKEALLNVGVKDSKRFSKRKILFLSQKIRKIVSDFSIKSFSAEILNQREKNLDEYEREAILEIVEELGGGDAIADYVSKPELVKGVKVVKNGERFIPVAAASILASAHFFKKMEKIGKEYGEIGSGNPNDPVTMKWMRAWWKENKSWPPVVRTFYKTVGRLEKESSL